MHKLLISLSIFIIVFLAASCQKETAPRTYSTEDSGVMYDEYGRTLMLHGLNTSSDAKYGDYLPWIIESDVEKEATEFGFNFVRLLTSWVAIEPDRGRYDEDYINELAERVEWYTSRGMYVMIDMHQDVYGAAVGGNGAPPWACITDGAEPIDVSQFPWWVKNIDPAVIAAWKNFWSYTEHKYLQDHYIMAWQKIMERFRDNKFVIGYDLMNEPWGGDLIKVFLSGEFEKKLLTAFYARMIPELRKTEPDKYLFFEPTPAPVTFGAPSYLKKIADSRTPGKLVYAPHCYPYKLHEGQAYDQDSKDQLDDWERERLLDVKKHGDIPLMCGEFGLSPSVPGFDDYLTDIHEVFDRNRWNWTYWSNDQGGWSPLNSDRSETPIAQHLIRTYPRATAGLLQSFSYDTDTDIFRMQYVSKPEISQPTEIFIPQRHYPTGWNIAVEGTTEWSKEWDATRQVLSVFTPGERSKIVLTIQPE